MRNLIQKKKQKTSGQQNYKWKRISDDSLEIQFDFFFS